MKRIILLIVWAFCLTGLATAQNANRSGFFLEAGFGGMVGSTPRTSISVANNVVQYKCVAGSAVDFGLGARFRFARHWAYEFKAEAQAALSDPVNTLVGRCLPVGFRYTSGELWRNYSLYAHLNLGGAISVISGKLDWSNFEETLYPNISDLRIKGYTGAEGFGAAYSVGVGVNITTHLYLEAFYNGQALFSCYGKNGEGTLNWGMAGIMVGYRF